MTTTTTAEAKEDPSTINDDATTKAVGAEENGGGLLEESKAHDADGEAHAADSSQHTEGAGGVDRNDRPGEEAGGATMDGDKSAEDLPASFPEKVRYKHVCHFRVRNSPDVCGDPRISADRDCVSSRFYSVIQLIEILSKELYSDIISWLPHGKGFVILDKKRFGDEVLPKHFKQSKFTSFTRKLNRWYV